MRNVNIKRRDVGYDTVTAYTCSDPCQIEELSHTAINARNKNSLIIYATFDIETTTLHDVYPPTGYMYHWQITIGTLDNYRIYYGRTWEEWIELMNKLIEEFAISEERHLVIYVHNLGYEYQFMYEFLNENFDGYKMFASKKRKPIKVTCNNGLEFRCSYFLTNMSLAKAVKNEKGVMHCKASGDLDYHIIRTPNTELTDEEFGYCISDVVCLHEFIGNRLANEKDTLLTIPLTSTAYVRRDVRKSCREDRRYREKVFKKSAMTETVYTLLKEASRGGDTHANRYLSGKIWTDCDSYDVASSYPYQLIANKYPMGKFSPYGSVDSREELTKLCNDNACLFRLNLFDVMCRTETIMPYIPKAKCQKIKNGLYDNGRVLSADHLSITVTDIDWEIIQQQYDYSTMAVTDMHICDYDYLPDCILNPIRDYFLTKSKLKQEIEILESKGIKSGEEYENLKYLYGKSKNKLNGIFGMMYTDPVRDEIYINDSGEWDQNVPDIAEALEKFYKSRNSFLVYAWGVWTTCHARKHLSRLVSSTGQGTIYCDTDSAKAFNVRHETIDKLNADIRAIAEDRGAYADVDGKRYYMGVYEKENDEPIQQFITLGAKKYAYVDDTGLHVTISGVSKETGKEELHDIHNFKNGFTFTESAGQTLYYNDNIGIHTMTVNGCTFTTASNIGMVDSTYTIGITDDYAELIDYENI